MQIEEKHLRIIRSILAKHARGLEVLVFGSRVHGRQLKKFSDLDLVVRQTVETHGPVAKNTLLSLKDDFRESNLPFKVDLQDWASLSPEFKEIILKDCEVLDF